ncbi:unnamed protein product, partial [Allacma fusca]
IFAPVTYFFVHLSSPATSSYIFPRTIHASSEKFPVRVVHPSLIHTGDYQLSIKPNKALIRMYKFVAQSKV